MTPMQAFKFIKEKKLDFKELMLLEQMTTYPKEVLTQTLVNDAMKENICSQATTHKYVARLKRRKYVKDVRVRGQDERCHYIAVTDEGRDLIGEWS